MRRGVRLACSASFDRRSVWKGSLVAALLLTATAGAALMVAAPLRTANAMGQAPGTCNNEYNGMITALTVDNGTGTFNVLANPGMTIDVKAYASYNTTLVIRMDNSSTKGNSNPGSVWYNMDAFDYEDGVCGPSAGPGQSVTIKEALSIPPLAPGSKQAVTWNTLENSVEYNVYWVPVPTIPANASAFGITSSEIQLKWSPSHSNIVSSPVTAYEIYRSTAPIPSSGGGTPYSTVGQNATSFADTQVQSGKTYYYRISAINSYGESSLSSQVKAVPPPADKSWLVIDTAALSTGYETYGYGITLSQGGTVVATQYSPANFTIDNGMSYAVTFGRVDNFVFSRWGDEGLTQSYNPRTIETSASLMLTAFFQDANGSPSHVAIPGNPWGVAVDSLTNRVYVTNLDDGNVSVIDGSTDAVVASIPVGSGVCSGSCPESVAVNPTTNEIYVTHSDSCCGLTVINGATNSVIGTIPVASTCSTDLGCNGIGVDANSDRIYVANSGGSNDTVSVVDGSTNKVIATIPVGRNPSGVAVDEKTDTVYVADSSSDAVSVIDGNADTVRATITLPQGSVPSLVAVNPATDLLYVANYGSGSISVINGTTNAIIGSVAVPTPYTLAVNPTTNLVYTSDFNTNTIYVLGGPSFNVLFAYPEANSSQGIGIDSVTNDVFISNSPGSGFLPGTVSVFNGSPASSSSSPLNSKLLVTAQDTEGDILEGYEAVLNQSGSAIVAKGYIPATFTLDDGQAYTVGVDSYGSCRFDYWSDTGSTTPVRPISITNSTHITAVLDCDATVTTTTTSTSSSSIISTSSPTMSTSSTSAESSTSSTSSTSSSYSISSTSSAASSSNSGSVGASTFTISNSSAVSTSVSTNSSISTSVTSSGYPSGEASSISTGSTQASSSSSSLSAFYALPFAIVTGAIALSALCIALRRTRSNRIV